MENTNENQLGGVLVLVLIFLAGYWLGKRARRGRGIVGAALSVIDGGRGALRGSRDGLASGSAPYPASPEIAFNATSV